MIFFTHIPKAGGSTLRQYFFNAFGSDNICKVWGTDFGSDVDVSDFENFDTSKYKAIMGHLPIADFLKNEKCNKRFLQKQCKIISAVRDPLDRAISLYNFQKLNPLHPAYSKMSGVKPEDYLLNNVKANFQFEWLRFKGISEPKSLFDHIEIFRIENSVTMFKDRIQEHYGLALDRVDMANLTARFASQDQVLFDKSMMTMGCKDKFYQAHSLDLSLYEMSK